MEAGDWEGVVLAAAQFEGQPDVGSHGGSQDHVWDDGSEPSLLARGGNEKLENIRAEVELLVRRIVPDEIGKLELHCTTQFIHFSFLPCRVLGIQIISMI